MNNELKKVKHDYGAQISYLYGLHLMGQHERLGSALKDIINKVLAFFDEYYGEHLILLWRLLLMG